MDSSTWRLVMISQNVFPLRCRIGLVALVVLAVGCTPAESSDDMLGEAIPNVEESSGPEEPTLESARSESERPELRAEQSESPAERPVVMVPSGANLTLQLNQSLSTESNQAGDPFGAVLVADVTGPDGGVLIPAGSWADGVVAVAQESRSADEYAVLELQLVSIEVGGKSMLIQTEITEAQVQSDTRDSGGETAAKIGVGTAAGAIVGGLIGGSRRGALIGAGAGAVAGTAVAVSTDDGHAKVEEGTIVVATLVEPLVLDAPSH
jgi:hypothetical protein